MILAGRRTHPAPTWTRNQTYNRIFNLGVLLTIPPLHALLQFRALFPRFPDLFSKTDSEPDNRPTRSTNGDSVADTDALYHGEPARRRPTRRPGMHAYGPGPGGHRRPPYAAKTPSPETKNLACARACPPGGAGQAWLGDEEPTRESAQAGALGRRLSPSRHKFRERASLI